MIVVKLNKMTIFEETIKQIGIMKVTVNEESKKKEYPKLMVGSDIDLIVFMTSYGKGFVVKGNNYNDIGDNCNTWAMDNFKDFNGSVTLQND